MDRYKYNYIIDRCVEAYIGTVVDPWIRVDEWVGRYIVGSITITTAYCIGT